MEIRNDNQLQNNNETEEVLVTNAAIKATDVLFAVGMGAWASFAIVGVYKKVKEIKAQKEQLSFNQRVIARMLEEGRSQEEITNVAELLSQIK